MTPQEFADLPRGTVLHTPRKGRACQEDVLYGHAGPGGRLPTLSSRWAGGGTQVIREFEMPYLHLPEDCENSRGGEATSRTARRVA